LAKKLAVIGLSSLFGVVLILIGVLWVVWSSFKSTHPIELKSGRKVQLISREIKHFQSGEVAYYVSYLANEPLNDIDRMNAEEEEVWQTFGADADRYQMNAAIIAPTAVKNHLFLGSYYSYNYVYKKIDGKWILTNKPKPEEVH
jgi:ABC-type glycerol-3-phosphate transport system permease component